MTTDENIITEMLGRVTNPERDNLDELGVQMFCMVVRSNNQLVHKAQELILTKIRSSNVTEATKAIALLEECMTKCGPDFQEEAAKFRFLNELIRLVSKNYHGAVTPKPIKQRIMECLLLWTTVVPQKTKIREVYDMLKKEGGSVEHANVQATVEQQKNVLGIDEKMLAKLLQSGDQENLKRANLLIQNSVNQETRRTELMLQHKSELQEVQNTVNLLNQMLDTFEESGGDKETIGSETAAIMQQLYLSCKKHKPILNRLPELIENTEQDLIADTLESNDALQLVMTRYKSLVKPKETAAENVPKRSTPLLLAAPATEPNYTSNTDLLTDLLKVDMLGKGDAPEESKVPALSSEALAEIDSLFNSITGTESSSNNMTDLFGSLDEILEPVSVFAEAAEGKSNGLSNETEKRGFRELREIDELSAELFKQSLQSDRVGSFQKEPEKRTLNDLYKERQTPKPKTATSSTSSPSKIVPNATLSTSMDKDDLMLTAGKVEEDMATNDTELLEAGAIPDVKPVEAKKPEALLKHLSDISIDLDDVTPTGEEHLLMDDDDMKITLTFTENRPSKNVSVIVISALNKSKLPVNEFQFEASCKKPTKVRLLPPTSSAMPPFKPFRPPTPINQIMLLLNTTGRAVDVTCIVGYKLGEDPDPIKESIVAKDIPFVE